MCDIVSLFMINVYGLLSVDIDFKRDDFLCKFLDDFKINFIFGYIKIIEELISLKEGVVVVWGDIFFCLDICFFLEI